LIEQQRNDLCYLQFAHYRQFPEIIHGVFTRQGGYSTPPYRGLNTSTSLKVPGADSVENVVRNRQLTLRALDLPPSPCVTLWQVHGADVMVFDARDEWRTDWAYRTYYEQPWTPQTIRKADALVTQERGITLALSFADCTPILLYDPVQHVIGMAHGGWRGTARGVVVATVEAMSERFGCRPADLYAGIGPAIDACCYEITETVQQIFLGRVQFDDMPTHEHYRGIVRESVVISTLQLPDRSSLRLDLATTNYNQLLLAGLLPEHIEVTGICTGCHTDRFFSHRREHARTGRFPVIMALKAEG
jgi:YfiH family protein